jgi:hypothetical protein
MIRSEGESRSRVYKLIKEVIKTGCVQVVMAWISLSKQSETDFQNLRNLRVLFSLKQ